MSRVFKLEVSESTEKLEFLLKQERNTRKRERLQFLYWYKTGQVVTRKELGKLLNRSQIAISHWIKRYRDQGLQGLLHLNYRGGNLAPSISLDIQRQLKEKLAQPEGMSSYKEIQTWLQKTHGLEVPYSTVFGTVKYRLKATLKVPRPYAIEHDPQAVEDFKKKVPEYLNKIATHCLKKYSSIRYWAQDESRFGLKTLTGRVITALGTQPQGLVQWPFEAFYTYGAVEPLTGGSFFLIFSHLDSDCFQCFLDEFSQAYPDSLNVMQ